jgi:hypothetical protein
MEATNGPFAVEEYLEERLNQDKLPRAMDKTLYEAFWSLRRGEKGIGNEEQGKRGEGRGSGFHYLLLNNQQYQGEFLFRGERTECFSLTQACLF